jgi:hypothetical protein
MCDHHEHHRHHSGGAFIYFMTILVLAATVPLIVLVWAMPDAPTPACIAEPDECGQ